MDFSLKTFFFCWTNHTHHHKAGKPRLQASRQYRCLHLLCAHQPLAGIPQFHTRMTGAVWYRGQATRMKKGSHDLDLPTPKYFCQYFGQPMSIFSDFFVDAPPISQNKTVSKVNFSIIYLVRTVCELTSLIIQTHYTRSTILFTSAKVVLQLGPHNTFFKKKKHHVCCLRRCPHVLSWTVVVWSEFVCLVLCILPLPSLFHAATYHRQLQIQTRHIGW